MTMPKFTPGPWFLQFETGYPHPIVQRAKEGGFVVMGESSEREQADAHLIAAAPELYEALEKLLEGLMLDTGPIFDRILAAECAMRKARGES